MVKNQIKSVELLKGTFRVNWLKNKTDENSRDKRKLKMLY